MDGGEIKVEGPRYPVNKQPGDETYDGLSGGGKFSGIIQFWYRREVSYGSIGTGDTSKLFGVITASVS